MPWEIYIIRSQEKKIETEPGFEPRTSVFLARRIAQGVERRATNPEVRLSNPGSGSNFSLEIFKCHIICFKKQAN